uniref:Uncharacterized protein n=1 Tax=Zea mays TaxID=4577 RepID=A0A804RI49_MAIZE
MANSTLHDQLHSRSPLAAAVSSWRGHLTIALGAARGIEYILLDDAWTAKIADFGLSSQCQRRHAAGAALHGGHGGRYAESVTSKNVVEFAVPHILADDIARVLDPRPRPARPRRWPMWATSSPTAWDPWAANVRP